MIHTAHEALLVCLSFEDDQLKLFLTIFNIFLAEQGKLFFDLVALVNILRQGQMTVRLHN